MAGVLTIEEYVHSEEARDDNEIHKMRIRSIYGKCKSSRKIDRNLLWLDYNYYSNDAAEALTSQAPDGKNPPCMPPASSIHTHTCPHTRVPPPGSQVELGLFATVSQPEHR
jgi:hypothetical protein